MWWNRGKEWSSEAPETLSWSSILLYYIEVFCINVENLTFSPLYSRRQRKLQIVNFTLYSGSWFNSPTNSSYLDFCYKIQPFRCYFLIAWLVFRLTGMLFGMEFLIIWESQMQANCRSTVICVLVISNSALHSWTLLPLIYVITLWNA